MTKRRTVLQWSLASTLAAGSAMTRATGLFSGQGPARNAEAATVAGMGQSSHDWPAQTVPVVLYDRRHGDGLPLAQNLRNALFAALPPAARQLAAPARLEAVEGDLTPFWYGYLAGAWSRDPVPLAGVSTADTLFCLEQLARDQRMRVLWYQEHPASTLAPAAHTDNDNNKPDRSTALVSWVIGRHERRTRGAHRK